MRNQNKVINILIGLAFLCLSVAAIALFLKIFSPKHVPVQKPFFESYSRDNMMHAVSPQNVLAELDTIRSFGSRFIGQPGYYKTQDYIKKSYQQVGLTIYEHDVRSVSPVTIQRDIFGKNGEKINDVELYPFLPNHFQPMVTPDSGITGTLVLLTDSLINSASDFSASIGVISHPLKEYQYNWLKYAKLGVKALIVANPVSFDSIDWKTLSATGDLQPKQMVSSVPINYVRLAATPGIFNYLNTTITLKVRTEYRNVTTKTLLGQAKTNQKNSEAVIICSGYDSYGLLPDKAPGTLPALSLATQLSVLKGIQNQTDSLRRDLYFMAFGGQMMNHYTLDRFLYFMGSNNERKKVTSDLLAEKKDNDTKAAYVATIASAFSSPEFMTSPSATMAIAQSWDKSTFGFFAEQLTYTINSLIVEFAEYKLQAKIKLDNAEDQSINSPAFLAFKAVKDKYDQVFSASGYPLEKLLASRMDFIHDYAIKELFHKRIIELDNFHKEVAAQYEQGLEINRLFHDYRTVVVLSPELYPTGKIGATERVTYSLGGYGKNWGYEYNEHGAIMNGLFGSAVQRLGLSDSISFTPSVDRNHDGSIVGPTVGHPMVPYAWSAANYPAAAFVSLGRVETYQNFAFPCELPYMRNVSSVKQGLKVFGEVVLSTAFGNGEFKNPLPVTLWDFYGTIYMSDVGQSVIPSFPVKNALYGHKSGQPVNMTGVPRQEFEYPGRYMLTFVFTDPYGRYNLKRTTRDVMSVFIQDNNPDAVVFGANGIISHIKDQGTSAQSIYKSMGINQYGPPSPVNLILYRGNPVTITDITNPQTLKEFTEINFLDAKNLSEFDKKNIYFNDGTITNFLVPDKRFYLALKSGAPGNEMVQQISSFALGSQLSDTSDHSKEITGKGYLSAEHPLFCNVPLEASTSMNVVNTKRLSLQKKYQMADEQAVSFQQKSMDLLTSTQKELKPFLDKLDQVRNSLAYSILNHPVIRQNISEAIFGVLWYLALLVPFVFFFEKLVFGFADIRKQLVAEAVIFLIVFFLLRFLHPAFLMIRSSLMILLGFVIFMISIGITLIFSGKFQENLEELRKKQGKVSAAEVDTFGVLGTAFLLGLNNMHRRKVRTGLTCATLVLITVVMICFSSLNSNVVNRSITIGKATYQGFSVTRPKSYPVLDAEFAALQSKYGKKYPVCERLVWSGVFNGALQVAQNPQCKITYDLSADVSKSQEFSSFIQLSWQEPLKDKIEFITTPRWFTRDQEQATNGTCPVFISDAMARKLSISKESVDAGPVPVSINSTKFVVQGIFSSESFEKVKDLDGRSLLPLDISAMTTVQILNGYLIAPDDAVRIAAENVIITPLRQLTSLITITTRSIGAVPSPSRTSVAVALPDLTFKESKQVIDQYLEQSQTETAYGIDGIAYSGIRTRSRSASGLLDMLIPLLIAALTVLNTMRGSVYERKDEIFVYNAVGIAPKYIAFMFFAEAFVYSVVGSVLGYLISQGLGRILTELHLTGGLNMTFTSAMSIYASIVIAISVFISTYFPARTAMEIASPAEDAGWELPEPEGDYLVFDLPFTFNYKDRIAILQFFNRYFLDHGEGSAGQFFAGIPEIGLSSELDPLANNAYVPQMKVSVWLKPFDLGVSQELVVSFPTDPETSEYKALVTLLRVSGTSEAWIHLNKHFVRLIRRHFLIWRAVPAADRQEMFVESKAILEQNVLHTTPSHEVVHV